MKNVNAIIIWSPRILGIIFVLFISLFALDVFSEYQGLAIILPLLIHLIPSLILLALIVIAWKNEIVGAIVFFGFAAWYTWQVGVEHWSWIILLAGPAVLVGILYLLSWWQRLKIKTGK